MMTKVFVIGVWLVFDISRESKPVRGITIMKTGNENSNDYSDEGWLGL